MINRISYLLALAVLFAVEAMAQSPSAKSVWVKGHVFEDKNNNGMQDKGEKGLSKVLISNGVHVISSDSRGAYAFEAEVGQSIFSIHPSAYQYANANKIGNANAYYLNPNNHISDTLVYNMPLQKGKVYQQILILRQLEMFRLVIKKNSDLQLKVFFGAS